MKIEPRKLPSIFVMGVPKAGTTKIADELSRSDEFSIGKIKEPKFFTHKVNAYSANEKNDKKAHEAKPTTIEDYESCYAIEGAEDKVLVDLSTDNFRHCDLVIPEILRVCIDPKFIVVLRNPVDRCYSSYLNAVMLGREKFGFKDAIDKEQERISLGWGPVFHYAHYSFYADSLRWCLEKKINLKVFIYEEIFKDEESFRQFFIDAFGVEINADLGSRVYASGRPIPYVYDAFRFLWRQVPHKLRENSYFMNIKNSTRGFFLRKKKVLSVSNRSMLVSLFERDAKELARLLDRNEKIWEDL